MNRRIFRVLLILILPSLQNCGNGIGTASSALSPLEGTSSTPSLSEDLDTALSPSPPPPPPAEYILDDWNDPFPEGQMDASCLNNPKYNLCLLIKNPITMNGYRSFSPALTQTSVTPQIESKLFQLGVNVPSTGNLSNKNFKVLQTAFIDLAQPDPLSEWKFTYAGDNQHEVAQIQVFYWLNRMAAIMLEKTGKFYTENDQLNIDVFNPNEGTNASWNGSSQTLTLGLTLAGAELALDVSVAVHEVGHANLSAATNNVRTSSRCGTAKGCFGAIHEGVGDIYSFLIFPTEGSSLGEFFLNSSAGLRDARRLFAVGLKAADAFQGGGGVSGEIHNMGEVYSNIWYYVWSRAINQAEKREVETAFTEHLASLGSSDDFVTALTNIKIVLDNLTTNSQTHKDLFDAAYRGMGYNIP